MAILDSFLSLFGLAPPAGEAPQVTGDKQRNDTEGGFRTDYEDQVKRIHQQMMVDSDLVAQIQDLRTMYLNDSRVYKITNRTTRSIVKGGLKLETDAKNTLLIRLFNDYLKRCSLTNRQVLESHARGLFLEGNLPLQWVIGETDRGPRVVRAIRMPAETIKPNVGANGQFNDVNQAYFQITGVAQEVVATFALWQLNLTRLTPKNFDDMGSMGVPYLSPARKSWKQLRMTEDDLVIRRRTRAPQRIAHAMSGMSEQELLDYEKRTRINQQNGNYSDYFFNAEGKVTPIDGDANMDQIKDVIYLLDTMFSGAPAPKAMFGYVEDVNRDILEEIRRDYHDELDSQQDFLGQAYRHGFVLDLLLQGINPERFDFEVVYAERNSESPNQRMDRALKAKAIGASDTTVFETAGLDAEKEVSNREYERETGDPYPTYDQDLDDPQGNGDSSITITERNARQGESATAIDN